MKILIDDTTGTEGMTMHRRAVAIAEVFAEAHATRPDGQRECVIYASTEDEPMFICWWTKARAITVRVQYDGHDA
jgi:hypothetical protein